MAMFVTIGYGDEAGYERTDPAVRDAAHAHDAQLRAHGAQMGIAGRPRQVRNPGGDALAVTEGSFLRAELPVAGFSLIEAETLEEAIELVARTPCAVAHGVVEVWPLEETP